MSWLQKFTRGATQGSVQLTSRQLARFERVGKILAEKGVPTYPAPLCVADDRAARPRPGGVTALRAAVLHLVAVWAEEPSDDFLGLLQEGLSDHVSPSEQTFLKDREADPDAVRRLMWRNEAAWTLLWALGLVESLDWPIEYCDQQKLGEGIWVQILNQPKQWSRMKLRPTGELLDKQQLTLQLHWAIRQALLDSQPIPANLDWRHPLEQVTVRDSLAVALIEQRHHALNWLLDAEGPDWDDVDTAT